MRYLKILKVSLSLFPLYIYGQGWEEVRSIDLAQNPSSYTVDYQGNIFLGFEDGKLLKYSAEGQVLENFSLSNYSSITSIDVQNNLKPFLFYFDNQRITILDRFSSVPKNYLLSDLDLEIGMAACPAPDGDFWIIENNPQRLKKIDPLLQTTVLEVQIQVGDSIKRIQAYQNILIIGSEEGMKILDQFGGVIQDLEINGFIDFQIDKGRLYCISNEEVIEINPYKGTVKKALANPSKNNALLKSNDLFLSLENKRITYYQLTE
ncbi:hypothetical protein [Ekhidna sp.]